MEYLNQVQFAVASAFTDVPALISFAGLNMGLAFANEAVRNMPVSGYPRVVMFEGMRAMNDVAKMVLWDYVRGTKAGAAT